MESPFNACLERAIVNKKDWLTSLSHGCLNKGIGEKIRRYSYLQALSARKLKTVILNPTLRRASSLNTTLQNKENLGTSDDVKSPDPRLSPVILEDFTKPPRAIEETPPMLFTPEDFFIYLSSDKWSGKTSLRVLGGELLLLLITALIHLEETRQIISHVMYANLNSRQPTAGQGARNGKWTYEKMVVELIYYDKAVSSNIPYIVEEQADPMATPRLIPAPLDLKPEPYIYLKHPVNSIRLRPGENWDPKEKIIRLERTASIDGSEVISSKAFKVPLAPPQVAFTEPTDWIAENPFFGVPIPEETVEKIPASPEGRYLKTMDSIGPYFSSPSPMIITSTSPRDIFGSDELGGELSFNPSVESYSLLNSAELIAVEPEAQVLKSFNLSRNELYVTGLYDMRPENRVSTDEKLRKRKHARDKKQIERELAVFESLQEKSKLDLTQSFKSLRTFKKKLMNGPQKRVMESKTMISSRQNLDATRWRSFQKEHEECEMESALKNVLEEGILSRLKTLSARPKIEDPRFAQKVVKGKPPPQNKTRNSIAPKSGNINFSHFGNNYKSIICNDNDFKPYNMAPSRKQSISLDETNPTNCFYQQYKNQSFNKRGGTSMDIEEEYSRSLMALLAEWRATLDHGVEMRLGFGQESKPFTMQNVFCVPPKSTSTLCNENSDGDEKSLQGLLLRKKSSVLDARSKSVNEKFNKRHSKHNRQNEAIREREVKFFNTNNLNVNFNAKAKGSDSGETVAKESKNSSQTAAAVSRNSSFAIKSRNISLNLSNFSEEETLPPTNVSGSIVTVHQEGEDRSRSTEPAIRAPTPIPALVKPTVSEQLKGYTQECTCDECVLQEPYLLHYRIQANTMAHYPLVLGRLRRNFPFLANKDYQPSKKIFNQKLVSAFTRMSETQAGEQLLAIMNDIMIRKERLSSSLGHTYVTITFTKADVVDKMLRANSVLS